MAAYVIRLLLRMFCQCFARENMADGVNLYANHQIPYTQHLGSILFY